MSDGSDSVDGIMIEYKCYRRIGESLQVVTDQVAYDGSLLNFKKDPMFKNTAVQRYTQITDGEMDEGSVVVLNETLKPLPPGQQLDPAMKGAIGAGVITAAPPLQQAAPTSAPVPLVMDLKPKILKDGDSFIKIEGNSVSRLVWVEYDEIQQPFDQRVRIIDGADETKIIEVTKWKPLGEV